MSAGRDGERPDENTGYRRGGGIGGGPGGGGPGGTGPMLTGTLGDGLGASVGSADALGIAMPAANNGAPTHAAMTRMNFLMEVSDRPVHIGFPGSTGALTRW